MLDMGFIHDIKKIIARLPVKRQTLFYSATMEPEVTRLARTLVQNPVQVTIEPEKPAVERIDQKILFVDRSNKDELLVELITRDKMRRVIIFTQMKHVADKVTRKLDRAGIISAAIHGNKSQTARTRALHHFKTGQVQALVATDIAARGIDVDRISCVINYDMPVEPETYVHRIGRTARAGNDGAAISLCSAPERDYLRAIEKLVRTEIPADCTHPHHCAHSMNATGAAARPAPKTRQPRRKPAERSRNAAVKPRRNFGRTRSFG
jgi:ATP-dependent RNA helicase RhlE